MVVHGLLRFHACRASSFRLEQLLENSDSSEFSLLQCDQGSDPGRKQPRAPMLLFSTEALHPNDASGAALASAAARRLLLFALFHFFVLEVSSVRLRWLAVTLLASCFVWLINQTNSNSKMILPGTGTLLQLSSHWQCQSTPAAAVGIS